MILAAPSAQTSADTFTTVMDHVAQGFEALGALILVVGIVWSCRAGGGGVVAVRPAEQGLSDAAHGYRPAR
jgi:hypothetical protein